MTNTPERKTLHRSDDRMIAGVCSGVAEYLGIDVTLVRVLTAVTVIFGGTGVLLYLAAWLIMPDSRGETVINWRPTPAATGSASYGPPVGSAPESATPTTQAPADQITEAAPQPDVQIDQATQPDGTVEEPPAR